MSNYTIWNWGKKGVNISRLFPTAIKAIIGTFWLAKKCFPWEAKKAWIFPPLSDGNKLGVFGSSTTQPFHKLQTPKLGHFHVNGPILAFITIWKYFLPLLLSVLLSVLTITTKPWPQGGYMSHFKVQGLCYTGYIYYFHLQILATSFFLFFIEIKDEKFMSSWLYSLLLFHDPYNINQPNSQFSTQA